MLPKLPVPSLGSTLEKYINSLKPIILPEQFENTKKLVVEFGKKGGEGEFLQKQLEEYARTKDNWVGLVAQGSNLFSTYIRRSRFYFENVKTVKLKVL